MDGIASGRPVLSTDVPECRLYPEWIRIIDSPDDAVEGIRRLFAQMPSADHAQAQVAFAREHTWADRARTLAGWLKQRADAST